MYIVTFYSYKGGVGRTMSLMNVAAELARRGRRCLVVDFDLEAPGITSYDLCATANQTPGLVDYITDYLGNSVAPSVDAYLHQCSLTSDGQELTIWLMTAGHQDADYKNKFHSINWDYLYSEQSGYLLMENLKAQWEKTVRPDYVLIDSRTGHTDVSGICTRQLPDSVVFTYFPNRQNLVGLKQIVEEVRWETTGPRKKHINLHFVASNIPNVDDEHQILEKNLTSFREELGYKDYVQIHHYDNLDLVDQVIFTLGHRRTRLAKEYLQLVDAIIMQNPADRDGALSYLKHLQRDASDYAWKDIADKLAEIEGEHPSDAKILSALGDAYEAFEQIPGAISLFEQAIEIGAAPAAYRNLGILYLRVDKKADAVAVFKKMLERSDMAASDVQGALRMLIALDEQSVPVLLTLPSVQSLDPSEKLNVVHELMVKPELLECARSYVLSIIADPAISEKHRGFFQGQLPLIQISLGRYREAMAQLGGRAEVLSERDIQSSFNYAMAEWAETGVPPADLFLSVIEIASEDEDDEEYQANYYQCLAVANWAVGDYVAAKEALELARAIINAPGFRDREFSCWRYLNVRPDTFRYDLALIGKLIDGMVVLPEFVVRNADKAKLL